MLCFSLVANMVQSQGFPGANKIGKDINNDNVLTQLTGLSDPSMQAIFLGVTGLSFIGVVALCYLTGQVSPLGLYVFGVVFWTAWLRTNSIFSYGEYLPVEFTTIFTVLAVFLFIGAIIGMLTGSG